MARSKHCKLCNHCVAHFDHHCPWVRKCIAQNNISAFTRFIFWHAVMCTMVFVTIFLSTSKELAYLVENLRRRKGESFELWIGIMNYFNSNPLVLFFVILSAFTAVGLWLFYFNICFKFVRNITINEEYKFEKTISEFQSRLEGIQKELSDKNPVSKVRTEELMKEMSRIRLWVRKHRANYKMHNKVWAWVKLMLF